MFHYRRYTSLVICDFPAFLNPFKFYFKCILNSLECCIPVDKVSMLFCLMQHFGLLLFSKGKSMGGGFEMSVLICSGSFTQSVFFANALDEN